MMTADRIVVISFKDLAADEEVRERVDTRCRALGEEFPETTRFEMTLAPDGSGHTAHVRVSGRSTHLDAHGSAIEMELAAERALEKAHAQLRTVHDKRIFARRRAARKASPKA
jgi:ribosome-associated translation inhibitor RaiA